MSTVIEDWLNTANGRRLDYDGAYGLQCVDAVDAYAEDIFGVPWETSVGGVGGAKELLDRVPDEFWIRIDNDPNNPNLLPQRGDVLVWAGRAGVNPFGHTAICLSANANGVTVLQQDGFAPPLQFVNNNLYSNKPAHIATLGWDNYGTGMISGWLRPRANKLISKEGLSMSEYKEIMKKLQRLEDIVTENQKRIGQVSGKILNAPIKRDGKNISLIQEIADNKTIVTAVAEKALTKADLEALKGQIKVVVSTEEPK